VCVCVRGGAQNCVVSHACETVAYPPLRTPFFDGEGNVMCKIRKTCTIIKTQQMCLGCG
jgi:hypothetical protein